MRVRSLFLLLLLPLLMWAQQPTGNLIGAIGPYQDSMPPPVSLSLFSLAPNTTPADVQVARDFDRRFQINGLSPGWYVLFAHPKGCNGSVKAVKVEASKEVLVDEMLEPCACGGNYPVCDRSGASEAMIGPRPASILVLTVCEALHQRHQQIEPLVIVGFLTPGTPETLWQDCPNQLVTGEIAWPNAISIFRAITPPRALNSEVKKKKAALLATRHSGAQARPESVVAFYGRLVVPDGFTTADLRRNAAFRMAVAPAGLFGRREWNFRVLP